MNSEFSFNRRKFIKTVALCGAAASVGNLELEARAASEGDQPAWVDRAMRWAQLTLVEDDPGKFDPDFWLDYFQRTHSMPHA